MSRWRRAARSASSRSTTGTTSLRMRVSASTSPSPALRSGPITHSSRMRRVRLSRSSAVWICARVQTKNERGEQWKNVPTPPPLSPCADGWPPPRPRSTGWTRAPWRSAQSPGSAAACWQSAWPRGLQGTSCQPRVSNRNHPIHCTPPRRSNDVPSRFVTSPCRAGPVSMAAVLEKWNTFFAARRVCVADEVALGDAWPFSSNWRLKSFQREEGRACHVIWIASLFLQESKTETLCCTTTDHHHFYMSSVTLHCL